MCPRYRVYTGAPIPVPVGSTCHFRAVAYKAGIDPVMTDLSVDKVENGGNGATAGSRTVTYNNDPLNRTSMIDNGTETVYGSPSGVKEQRPQLLKGDKAGQDHQPVVVFERHKGKEWKVNRITHVHTTMRAQHYDQDVPTAHRLRTISGVGSTFGNGGSLEVYVPREDGGRGGFFKTRDGEHLTDLNNKPVPH